MKKLILPISLFVFFLQFAFGHAYAQEEPSNKLTCDQVWDIIGTDECRNWVVSNDEGGVWCNLPESRESLQPWIYGPPPTYTFTPGTCKAESGDEPEEELESDKSTPSIPTAKSLNDWIKEMFGELIPQTESLLDNAPAETDLKPADPPSPPSKELLTGVVKELDGFADMQLQDGTWVELKIGDVIPYNAKAFTGYDATMEIRFSDHGIIIMRSLEDFSFQILQTNPEAYRKELKLESGELRFKVQQSTIKTDMKVSTPTEIAAVVGTDFGVRYDKGSGVSIFEIYDGTIEIQDNAVHEKKILSSSYGSPIKRLEISKDGGIVEKIAVPKNQKGEKIPIWIYFVGVTVLIIGGLAFLKWRKRKSSGFRR